MFLGLVCAHIALIVSLPVFPSQDGPVHLYYVQVIKNILLTGSSDPTHYFALKSLAVPYLFHYAALVALELCFDAIVAEKILLVAYVALFAACSRYLVHSIAPKGSPWTLVALPFTLNFFVYMGFWNYCFGVAWSLFLCGYWVRRYRRISAAAIAGLIAGVVLLLTMHPVPVMVFLVFSVFYTASSAGCDLLAGLPANAVIKRHRLQCGLIVVVALIGACAVARSAVQPGAANPFPIGNLPQSKTLPLGRAQEIAGYALDEIGLGSVLPMRQPPFFRALMVPLAVTILLVVARSLAANRGRAFGDPRIALLAAALFCFIVCVVGPEFVNSGALFRERFAIYWVLFAIAFAASIPPERNFKPPIAGLALVVGCLILALQWQFGATFGVRIKPLLNAPPPVAAAPQQAAVLLPSDTVPEFPDPYYWASAHYCRRFGIPLVNTPWSRQPWIVVTPASPKPWNGLDPGMETQLLAEVVGSGGSCPGLTVALVDSAGPLSPDIRAITNACRLSELPSGSTRFHIFVANAPARDVAAPTPVAYAGSR